MIEGIIQILGIIFISAIVITVILYAIKKLSR